MQRRPSTTSIRPTTASKAERRRAARLTPAGAARRLLASLPSILEALPVATLEATQAEAARRAPATLMTGTTPVRAAGSRKQTSARGGSIQSGIQVSGRQRSDNRAGAKSYGKSDAVPTFRYSIPFCCLSVWVILVDLALALCGLVDTHHLFPWPVSVGPLVPPACCSRICLSLRCSDFIFRLWSLSFFRLKELCIITVQ